MKVGTIKSYVGFAIRSRSVIFGTENIVCKKCKVVLYDNNLGKNSADKLLNYLKKNEVKGFRINMEDVVSGRNCKVIGITNENLGTAIIKEMEESDIYE